MSIQRQSTWGKLVIIDMFLGGMGAATFVVAAVLLYTDNMKGLAQIGILIGPLLVIAGLFFLFRELGSKVNIVRSLSGISTSWLSRGVLIQVLFIVLSLLYSIPTFWFSNWLALEISQIIGALAFIMALVTGIYHGFFLSKAKGIALWTSPVLPVVSLFTALCTGAGLMLLIFLLYIGNHQLDEIIRAFTIFKILSTTFIIGEIIVAWSFLTTNPSITYKRSIKTINKSAVLAIVCLFIALLLLVAGFWIETLTYIIWASAISGLFLIFSGFIIRALIINAGYYYSLEISSNLHTAPH